MDRMTHITTYLLGLFVGGGKIDSETFIIDLPLKKWGMDVNRMNSLAGDILTQISSMFYTTYGFNVNYQIGNGKWLIVPIGNINIEKIKQDLKELGLPIGGTLISQVDLTVIKSKLLNSLEIESFLSGIFDTRASLSLSHRRFSDDAPVVSVEIPGSTKNFRFVLQLCSWLTDLGSITDQILYNHPNQHSASDPYYTNWKKGFKIRFLVKSFLSQHSFALKVKTTEIVKITKTQKREEQIPCILRKLHKPSPVSVHIDQMSEELPSEVRSKLFFHYLHFCAALGCEHAPKTEILRLIKSKNTLISFFPLLSKGDAKNQIKLFNKIHIDNFPHLNLIENEINVEFLLSNEMFKDYSKLDEGVAFLFAEVLKGKRHSGSMHDIINANLHCYLKVTSIGAGFDSPLLFENTNTNRAFICSSISNNLNQKLIEDRVRIEEFNINLS